MRRASHLMIVLVTFMLPGLTQLRAVAQASLQHSADITETVEWTWSVKPDSPDKTLPNILFIGDSITRGYYPEAVRLLKDRANCYLFASSIATGDSRLPQELAIYFKMVGLTFAVIHFNNGMHGWGYSEKAYAEGLAVLVKQLRAAQPQAQLIWASTTPVQKDIKDSATNDRIDKRNMLALKLMKAQSIPVDDQHALMMSHDDLHDGDIHYTAET